MFAGAYTSPARFYRGMTPRKPLPHRLNEAQKLGLALRALRKRYDLSQDTAAELAGTRQQNWQRYERGENNALLKVTLQRRLADAIGSSHEELLAEVAAIDGAGGQTRPAATGLASADAPSFEYPLTGRARAGPQGLEMYNTGETQTFDLSRFLGEDTRVLRLAGESMAPYADPGGFVTYNLNNNTPRRGQGIVIEDDNGQFYVKRYERMIAGKLYVTELHPEERELEFDMEAVRAIYVIGLRGD